MMITSNINNQTFKAKFLYSNALEKVVKYAIENGKAESLNNARLNIDKTCLNTRILMDMGINSEGYPFVSFSKCVPQYDNDDLSKVKCYRICKEHLYTSPKKYVDLSAYALNKIIQLGDNVPNNKMFKRIVWGAYNREQDLL